MSDAVQIYDGDGEVMEVRWRQMPEPAPLTTTAVSIGKRPANLRGATSIKPSPVRDACRLIWWRDAVVVEGARRWGLVRGETSTGGLLGASGIAVASDWMYVTGVDRCLDVIDAAGKVRETLLLPIGSTEERHVLPGRGSALTTVRHHEMRRYPRFGDTRVTDVEFPTGGAVSEDGILLGVRSKERLGMSAAFPLVARSGETLVLAGSHGLLSWSPPDRVAAIAAETASIGFAGTTLGFVATQDGQRMFATMTGETIRAQQTLSRGQIVASGPGGWWLADDCELMAIDLDGRVAGRSCFDGAIGPVVIVDDEVAAVAVGDEIWIVHRELGAREVLRATGPIRAMCLGGGQLVAATADELLWWAV